MIKPKPDLKNLDDQEVIDLLKLVAARMTSGKRYWFARDGQRQCRPRERPGDEGRAVSLRTTSS